MFSYQIKFCNKICLHEKIIKDRYIEDYFLFFYYYYIYTLFIIEISYKL